MVLFGFVSSFSMILLPTFTQNNLTNHHESFSISCEDMAWYVGSTHISQIIGSFLLCFCLRYFGKKQIFLLINVPMIIAWIILGISWSTEILFSATVVLGISIGYLEGTVSDYITQISHPQLRKSLASFTDIFRAFGAFLISGLGLVTTWRIASLVGVFLHVSVVILLFMLPETPKMLNMGGELGRAEKTLHWILGSPRLCQEGKELNGINVIVDTEGTSEGEASQQQTNPDGGISLLQQLTQLKSLKMFQGLGVVAILLLFSNFNGTVPSQPYIYMLSKDYIMPMHDSISAFFFQAVALVASILCVITTRFFNRNLVVVCSEAVATIATGLLAVEDSTVAFFSYSALVFATNFGLEGHMWSMLDDAFPQEGRVLAFRIAAAIDCLFNFIAVSSYAKLKNLIGIHYLFLFYSLFNLFGSILICIIMPKNKEISVQETSGKAIDVQKENDLKKLEPDQNV